MTQHEQAVPAHLELGNQSDPLAKLLRQVFEAYGRGEESENIHRLGETWKTVSVVETATGLGLEWEGKEADMKMVEEIISFIRYTDLQPDAEFRKLIELILKEKVNQTGSQLLTRLRTAMSPTQRTTPYPHILKVMYLSQTDHQVEGMSAQDAARTRRIYRAAFALHDTIGKGLIVQQENDQLLIAKDPFQDHAFMSAWVLKTALKFSDFWREQSRQKNGFTDQDLESITSVIKLHHVFEHLAKGTMTRPQASNLVMASDYYMLTDLALCDVFSVQGYEKFVKENVQQMILFAPFLYPLSSELHAFYDHLQGTLNALLVHVQTYPEHFKCEASVEAVVDSLKLLESVRSSNIYAYSLGSLLNISVPEVDNTPTVSQLVEKLKK